MQVVREHKIPPVRVRNDKKHWIFAEYKDPDLSLAEDKVGAKFQELLEAISKALGSKRMQSPSGAQKKRQ